MRLTVEQKDVIKNLQDRFRDCFACQMVACAINCDCVTKMSSTDCNRMILSAIIKTFNQSMPELAIKHVDFESHLKEKKDPPEKIGNDYKVDPEIYTTLTDCEPFKISAS